MFVCGVRALVFVAHGAGEHCSMYADVAHTLTQQSLFVFAHDHVGHGQSEGERMNIKNFQIYIRDCLQHIDLIRARFPSLPIFILGHSMKELTLETPSMNYGGAISILTVCERPQDFAGVVLVAPMIQMNPESATPFKVFVAKVLNHMAPSLCIGSIDPKLVSRDPKQVVQAYESDELVYHGGLRVSFGMQLMAASSRIETELPNISWPFLLLHGTDDKLCDIRGSNLMYNQAKSTDKKIKPLDAVPVPSPEKWEGCVRKGIRRKTFAKLLCGPVVVVDFRKSRTPVSPLSVHGKKVEIVEDYKYLGVHTDNKLYWTLNSTALYKKGQS
ncbi:hypothetical protein QTP86_032573, partial [Hemibagrus guttatus]